jgi:predicted nucleic acid-binding protein
MTRVFADTSYFIALIAPNDVAHRRALAFANQSLRLVTTAFVMTELAAYLSAPANRPLFNRLLASVRSNSAIDFVPATQHLFDQAAALYAARPDKSWSLVDCTSFVVMQSYDQKLWMTT